VGGETACLKSKTSGMQGRDHLIEIFFDEAIKHETVVQVG